MYCEMQGRENTGESIVSRIMLENLYPGKCGYKSETGGIMKNLRDSTTNKKVIIIFEGYIYTYYFFHSCITPTVILSLKFKIYQFFSRNF